MCVDCERILLTTADAEHKHADKLRRSGGQADRSRAELATRQANGLARAAGVLRQHRQKGTASE